MMMFLAFIPLFFIIMNDMDLSYIEIFALIRDLDLVPRNYYASDFFQILENEQVRANRIKCDLRALSERNHRRKIQYLDPFNVSASDCNYLSFPSE